MYIYIHIYIYMYIHTYKHTYRQTDIHTDRQTYRQTDIQTDIHTDRHTYIQTDRHTYRRTDRQTDRQTDIHTYIYIYIYTYIYIYVCGLWSNPISQVALLSFLAKSPCWDGEVPTMALTSKPMLGWLTLPHFLSLESPVLLVYIPKMLLGQLPTLRVKQWNHFFSYTMEPQDGHIEKRKIMFQTQLLGFQ